MTADEIPKVYELPDLEPAPASDLQSLLRRFIEYADWGAVRPLLDCLNEAGRHDDARELRRFLWALLSQVMSPLRPVMQPRLWGYRVRDLIGSFVFDLFAPESCVAAMPSFADYNPATDDIEGDLMANSVEASEDEPMAAPVYAQPWTAEGDIPNGAQVAVDFNTRTIRVHPAPVPVTPTEGE